MQGVQASGVWAAPVSALLELWRADGGQGDVGQPRVCGPMYGVLALAIWECTAALTTPGTLGAALPAGQDRGNGAIH